MAAGINRAKVARASACAVAVRTIYLAVAAVRRLTKIHVQIPARPLVAAANTSSPGRRHDPPGVQLPTAQARAILDSRRRSALRSAHDPGGRPHLGSAE